MAAEASAAGRLFLITGPSGVGKGTLVSALLQRHPQIWLSVSATTRAPRSGEQEGQHYFFLDRAAFDAKVAQAGLLEWAEFAGNRYGTPLEKVKHALLVGKNVLLEIEIAGAKQVKSHLPQSVLVFLEPPTWEELVSRLEGRGTDSPERRAERLELAQEELAAASFFDVVLVNDQVESVVGKLIELSHN
jgi:guanylate kinase